MTQEWKNTKCPITNSWLNNNEKNLLMNMDVWLN